MKPMRVITYIFICMVTRDLEIFSKLGLLIHPVEKHQPLNLPNGSNIGELRNVHQLFFNNQTLDNITKQSISSIERKFSPTAVPHFGGL